MNEEFKVKLTPKDDSAAYSQSLPAPINLKEDILVELAMIHKNRTKTTLPFSKYASPIFAQKKPNVKLRLLVDLRKINNLISDDFINNNPPVSTLVDAAQHLAGKKLFCNSDCSQAYHCLQMADQRSIEMLAFNFASRTFAYLRLAQGLSRALSAFSSFMREYLDIIIKANQFVQYVDDIGIAAKDADHLIANLRVTFKCIQEAGLKLTMHKCNFGATEIDFLARTKTSQGVKPQRQNVQKFTSLRKSYAPVPYGSKTVTPAQIKISVYTKELLAIYFAFKEFGHILWGAPKPVFILTDNKAVTKFFQMKIVPPALWNACEYVIQFNFVIAHIPGAQNTSADYLSRPEADPKDKLVLKIREDVQTLPIEINVQSAGVSQEEQIFYTNDDDETEEQNWARKEAIRKNPAINEPTVIVQTLFTNLVKQQHYIQVRLRKTNQIIIEQSKDAVLQQLKAQLLHEDYLENLLQQEDRNSHYANNLERIIVKDEILTRQYFDETGNVKYHQILFPQHLLQELLQSLHGAAHKHPGTAITT